MIRTRFAPSPTGPLHLGHAYSAWMAYDFAQAHGGACLLRIEDLDQSRARQSWEDQIYDDLAWLGITWPTPVMRQSDRAQIYADALDRLWDLGLLYPCTCTRRDIQTAVEAPQEGGTPLIGPDGVIYPGTCRSKPRPKKRPKGVALRLDSAQAFGTDPLQYTEIGPQGRMPKTIAVSRAAVMTTIGDPVVQRRDMAAAYHLAVVVDDDAQEISHVVRGKDLAAATSIHRILQRALGLPVPIYYHHDLIRDAAGKRLAKRDDARALAKYRADGLSPEDVRGLLPFG